CIRAIILSSICCPPTFTDPNLQNHFSRVQQKMRDTKRTYVRSSPSWKLLVQYSRGAPLSTPKKFSGLIESPCAPKEIVPKCSPGTKDKFLVRGSVRTSSKFW